MSKKDDASKALKKKLKKLKKLEVEIAALKDKAAGKPKPAKAGKKDTAKKDKKAAKSSAKGKDKSKSKAARGREGEAASEAAIKPATPSLVRSEPSKVSAKEATSVPQAPPARVAAG